VSQARATRVIRTVHLARALIGDHRAQGEQTACGIAVSPQMHHHQVMNDGAIPATYINGVIIAAG
jgi:hypothetical protein